MDKIKQQISQRLNELKMTQKELAEKINVHPANFNKRFNSGTMRVTELQKALKVIQMELTTQAI